MNKTNQPNIKLDSFWPYQTVVLADQISRYTLSVVRDHADINLSQWRVLAAVADKPGCTAAQVTAITPMDKTIVSRAVNSLLTAGLIKKTAHQNDKRRQSLETTKTGLEIYISIAADLNANMMDALEGCTPPQEFVKALKEYSAKMAQISPKRD